MTTNETRGITAEYALCVLFNIKNYIEHHRLDFSLCNKLIASNLCLICEANEIVPQVHIGKENGKTDFLGEVNGVKKTISLKTLTKKEGKICPQGGQPTYKSFHTYHPDCPRPAENLNRVQANSLRWNWIKDNIGEFLNKMQRWTFCCDYLILISNCDKIPSAELLFNKNYDFTKIKIEFNKADYMESPHKKKVGELSEFSTNIYHVVDGEKINIGEFQIHFKSRNVIKFRFYKSLFI